MPIPDIYQVRRIQFYMIKKIANVEGFFKLHSQKPAHNIALKSKNSADDSDYIGLFTMGQTFDQ